VVVVVPDRELSLAIGREGQNVRLAAKLTNVKIDITTASKMPVDESQPSNHEGTEQGTA
jgi:N utilization substance protein A